MPADFEPLAAADGALRLRPANYKLVLLLFLAFLTVSSRAFTGSVIAGFGPKAVAGRELTAWGVVLQGIFLILAYLVSAYLTEGGVL